MPAAVAWPDSDLNDVVDEVEYYVQNTRGTGQVDVEVGLTRFSIPMGANAKQVKYAQLLHLRNLMERRSGEERRSSTFADTIERRSGLDRRNT